MLGILPYKKKSQAESPLLPSHPPTTWVKETILWKWHQPKDPDIRYFWLWEPWGPSGNYSTLRLQHKGSHRQFCKRIRTTRLGLWPFCQTSVLKHLVLTLKVISILIKRTIFLWEDVTQLGKKWLKKETKKNMDRIILGWQKCPKTRSCWT